MSTCDILQSVYTGVTEKISLFLFQHTQKDTFRLPRSKTKQLDRLLFHGPTADNQCQNKVTLINTKKVSLELLYEVLLFCVNTLF